MTMRNISAAFDSRVDAESARQQVIGVGVAASEVHILDPGAHSEATAALPSIEAYGRTSSRCSCPTTIDPLMKSRFVAVASC
jgi:hypothetical protein